MTHPEISEPANAQTFIKQNQTANKQRANNQGAGGMGEALSNDFWILHTQAVLRTKKVLCEKHNHRIDRQFDQSFQNKINVFQTKYNWAISLNTSANQKEHKNIGFSIKQIRRPLGRGATRLRGISSSLYICPPFAMESYCSLGFSYLHIFCILS